VSWNCNDTELWYWDTPPPFYVDHLANVLRKDGVDIAKSPMVQLKYLKKIGLLSKGKIKMCLINCTKHSWQGVVLVTPAIQISIDSGTKLPASIKLVTIIYDDIELERFTVERDHNVEQ
jgi:hypothetical protein